MRIGITFDLVPAVRDGDGPDDRYEEFDKPETVEAIAAVLRDEGHEVVLLGDGRDFVSRVLDDPPDFVWNFAEGEGVGRSREARVPAVLEMLGIPYSGSDPLTMAVALDKDVAKRLVRSAGVAVPRGIVLSAYSSRGEVTPRVAELGAQVGYPLILKPAFEGSSKGIRRRCLVDSAAEATEVYRELATGYGRQPILVEEFIVGDEVTVGLLDDLEPTLGLVDGLVNVRVLGVMRIVPREPAERFIYSLEVKRDYTRRVDYEIPALLPAGVRERVEAAAVAAYRALGCRTVARIDFRLKEGIPYFLEANPLPGLAPVSSDLVILAQGYGIGHADLIRRILRVALARAGFADLEAVAS